MSHTYGCRSIIVDFPIFRSMSSLNYSFGIVSLILALVKQVLTNVDASLANQRLIAKILHLLFLNLFLIF